MNKIYRRLWSTARQCWVVASELTAPRGKASQTVGAGLLAASLLAVSSAALAAGHSEGEEAAIEDSQLLWAMQAAFGARSMSAASAIPSSAGTVNKVEYQYALVSDSYYRDSTLSGNQLLVVGSRSSLYGNGSVAYGNLINSFGNNNTAIGNEVQIVGGGYATGIGAGAVANGIGTTAVGNNAKAHTNNSIAIGSGAQTDSGAGISKIAIGADSYAGTPGWTGAIALGGEARAGYDSVAIGYGAQANAHSSVALGRGSITTEGETVSVGSVGKERRIVNVRDGAINSTSTEAVNGRQLNSARDLAQRGVNDAAAAQRTANGAKSTADQALANTKLVTQTSAGSGIRIGGENTGNVVSVSNKNGDTRYLYGVRNGTLSATSTDAVTGQQLFATNQRIDAASRSIATGNAIDADKRASATGSLSVAMGQLAKADGTAALALGHSAVAEGGNTIAMGSASGASGAFAVALGGNAKATHDNSVALGEKSVTTGARQVSVGNATMKRKIVNVDDAAINANSSDAVTGRQMFQESQRVSGLVRQAGDAGILYLGSENVGNGITVSNKNGGTRYINGVSNGSVNATSNDAVTGQQLFATNNNVTTAQNIANNALGRANALGGLVSQLAADGNVRLGGENTGTVLDVRNKSNVHRTLSGLADGAVNATSGDAITGKQFFQESQRVTGLMRQAGPAGILYLGSENVGNGITVSNKNGGTRYLNGVSNGSVNATSNDAVTGQQLFATNNSVAAARNVADSALGKANAVGGLVSQVAADGAVRLGGENTGGVLDVRNKANANRTLTGLKDGALNATSTEAVTGKQLNTTNTEVASVRTVATAAQTMANTARTTADSALGKANALGGLVSQVAADGNVRLGGENTGGVMDVRNKSNANRTVTGLKDGALNATSTEAVTGKQLNTTNTEVASVRTVATAAQTTANTAKTTADNALGKANTLGGLVSQVAADGNVRLGGENTGAVLDVRNKSGGARTLSGLADGAINATSTEAVTGKQLQATHDRLTTAQSRADAAHAGATAAQTTANQAKAKADATGNAVATSAVIEDRNRATATGNLAMAMGQAAKANGTAAFAMGHNATAAGDNAVSLGSASSATARAAVALGGNAKAKHENSVALGERSETGGINEVSVGNAATGLKRRVVNVDDARLTDSSTDAVTGKQLFATNEKVQTNEAVLAGHGTDLAAQSGRIADNRRDLDALRTEFEDFDPDLDGVVKFAADGSVDMAGGKLRGVAAGDISSAASTDAVNGGQLFATNERIASMEYGGRFFKIGTDEYSEDAYAGWFGVAIGESAEASRLGEGGVAVGGYARALGTNSVALGRGSTVMQGATKGFALGAGSRVEAEGGVALGADSKVMGAARGSVAIGEGSIADVAGTVSVGGEGLVRRITNVGRGVGLSDASTVAQLNDAIRILGAGAGMDASGNIIAPTYNVQGGTKNNVGDALAALDSAVVTADNRVDNLEGKLRSAFQDGPAVRNDGLNQLTFAGANGMVLSNVANGAIAADSRDAVNGGQLHSMQQQLNGRMDGLEQRIDGQPQAPQSRALTVAAADSTTSSAPSVTPAADEPTAPPPSSGDNKVVADAGNAPKSSPQPQADAPKPEAPTPQVDTAELEKMLARANEYSDGISREVDARLNKMDKRFNRMAAMSSAQSAMAMNTAGLNTYNRLGAGVGYSEGESAMAVGYQRVLNEKGSATFSLNGAFTNSGERSMGVGVGIGW